MHQLIVTFQDPLLGRAAREAVVELLGLSRDDERVVMSPAGGVLLVEALSEQLADVRRLLASLGATVLYDRVTDAPTGRTADGLPPNALPVDEVGPPAPRQTTRSAVPIR